MDGAEDVEIGSGTDVALVGREAEHCDRRFLSMRLDPQRGPTNRTLGDGIDTILKRGALPVASSRPERTPGWRHPAQEQRSEEPPEPGEDPDRSAPIPVVWNTRGSNQRGR